MNEIINLLQEKNCYLEKFFTLNEEELVRLMDLDFENIERFYEARDGILEILKTIDKKIEEKNQEDFSVEVANSEQKRQVLESMRIKNELVQRVLAQDLQILSCIEEEKSNIIIELRKSKTVRKAIGSYKSGMSKRVSFDESV